MVIAHDWSTTNTAMAKNNKKKSKAKPKKGGAPAAAAPATDVSSTVAAAGPSNLAIPEAAAATESTASTSPTSPRTNIAGVAEEVVRDVAGEDLEPEEESVSPAPVPESVPEPVSEPFAEYTPPPVHQEAEVPEPTQHTAIIPAPETVEASHDNQNDTIAEKETECSLPVAEKEAPPDSDLASVESPVHHRATSASEGTTAVLTVQPQALSEPTVESVDYAVPVPVEPDQEEPLEQLEQPDVVPSDTDFFSTLSKEEDGEEPVAAAESAAEPQAPAASDNTVAQVEEQLEKRFMEDPVVEEEKKEREDATKLVEDQLTQRFMEDPVVEEIKQTRQQEDTTEEEQVQSRLMETQDEFLSNLGSHSAQSEPSTAEPLSSEPPTSAATSAAPVDDFFSTLGANPDETAAKTVAETEPEPVEPAEPVVAAKSVPEDDFFSNLGGSPEETAVEAVPTFEPKDEPKEEPKEEDTDDFMASLSQPQKPEDATVLPEDDFFNQLGGSSETKEATVQSSAPVHEPAADVAQEDDFFNQLAASPEKPTKPAESAPAPTPAPAPAHVRTHKPQKSEADFFAQLGESDPAPVSDSTPATEPAAAKPLALAALDEDDDLLLTDEDEAHGDQPNPLAQSFAFLEEDDLLESDQDFLESDEETPAVQHQADFRAHQQQQATYFPSAPVAPAVLSGSKYSTPTMPSNSQFGYAASTPSLYKASSTQSTPSAAPAKKVDKNKSDAFDFPTGMIPKVVKKTKSHQQLPQSVAVPPPGLMPSAFGSSSSVGTPSISGAPPMAPPMGRPASNPYAPAPSTSVPPAKSKPFFEELPTIPVKPISRQASYVLSPPRAPFAQDAQPRRVSDSNYTPHNVPHAAVHSAPGSHHNSVSGPTGGMPVNPYAPPSGPTQVPPKTNSPYAPAAAASTGYPVGHGVPPKTSSPYAPPAGGYGPPPAVPPKTSSPYAPPPKGYAPPLRGSSFSGPPGQGVPLPQPHAAAQAASVAAAAAAAAAGPPQGPPRVSSRNAYAPPRGPARGSTPPVGLGSTSTAVGYSPNVSPKRVVQQPQQQSPRRYSEFKDIGQKSTVANETLLKRQFPVFRWSNSKNATCLIAPQIGYATSVSQTAIRILDVSHIVKASEDTAKFPGPLFSGKGPVKSKKKEVEKWVADHIALMDGENADADRVLLWKLVGVFLANDGVVNKDQIRAFLTPHFEQSATGDGSAFTSAMDLSTSSFMPQQGDSGPSFSSSDASHVLRHLQSGSKDAAIRHCMDRRLWGHALLISSTMGADKWQDVVSEFIKDDVRPLHKPSLQFLYSSFGGVDPTADCYGDWKETVSYILSNSSREQEASLVGLGDHLVKQGYVAAGHFCYVCSRTSLADKLTLLGSEGRDLDAILLSETYEFALGLKSGTAIPQMQLYKLVHAELLADLGQVTLAQRYAEYLNQCLKSNTDKNSSFQPAYINRLLSLSDRVSSSPGAASGSWFSRPKLDKVLGHLDKSLTKFVAGDQAHSHPGASNASDTVFSQIAATPGISRTTSVVDLSQQGQSGQSGYQSYGPSSLGPNQAPTRASTGNILRPANNAYDPRPSIARSSSAMDAGYAYGGAPGYERPPSTTSVHSVQSDYPRVMSPDADIAPPYGSASAYAPANAYAPAAPAAPVAPAVPALSASSYGPPAVNAYAPPVPNAYAPPSGSGPSGGSPYGLPGQSSAAPVVAPVPPASGYSPRSSASAPSSHYAHYGRSYTNTPEQHIEEEAEQENDQQSPEQDQQYQQEQYGDYEHEQYEPESHHEPEHEPEYEPEPEPEFVPMKVPTPAPAPAPAPKAAPKAAPAARGKAKIAPPPKPTVKPAHNPYDPSSPVKDKKPATSKYGPANNAYSPVNSYTPAAKKESSESAEPAEAEASYGYGYAGGYGGGYGGYDPYAGYEAPATDAGAGTEDQTAEDAENRQAGEDEAEAANADYPEYGVPSYGFQSEAAEAPAGDYGDDEGAMFVPAGAMPLPPLPNMPSVPLPGLEPPTQSTPPPAPSAAYGEDDDDFGIGNKKAAVKKEEKPADKDELKDGKKGWFGGWFKKGEQQPADDKKVYKAKLGEKSNFYYSEEHKRWINGDLPVEDQVKGAGGPPPPPKAKKAAPPPGGGAPPMGAPPAGATPRAPPVGSPAPGGAPPGRAPAPSGTPPMGGAAKPKTVDPLESFLTGGPPAGAPRKGARKSAKSRYVDIMN